MAQFFTFTPKPKEDGAIDFYTLMDVFDERKEDGTTSPAGHGERKIKFNDESFNCNREAFRKEGC